VPYDVNADLPPSVRSHLPEHAQDIFREAFNHAYAAHAHDPRQEEAAFRIAWAAVKRQYEKIGDEWVEKGGGEAPSRQASHSSVRMEGGIRLTIFLIVLLIAASVAFLGSRPPAAFVPRAIRTTRQKGGISCAY
jgi:cation transport regulator